MKKVSWIVVITGAAVGLAIAMQMDVDAHGTKLRGPLRFLPCR